MKVSAGSPHSILRWVGRLRDGRTFGQVHTARLVRRRHGHPHLFPASWPCLGWCSLLCSVKWALYPRAEFTWHPRPPLASLAVHPALAHPQWGGLQLWGKGSCSRAPGSLLSTYLFCSPRFPSPSGGGKCCPPLPGTRSPGLVASAFTMATTSPPGGYLPGSILPPVNPEIPSTGN